MVIVPPGRVSVIGTPELWNALRIDVAETLGQAVRMAAIAPATCGVAMEVPASQA